MIFTFGLLIYLWYQQSKDVTKSAEIILENDIGFTGSIVSYNKSTNHSFGVIKFRIIKSSKQEFNISDPRVIYPYRLSKNYGEFYGYIPLGIKVGQLIRLYARKKTIEIYDGTGEVAQTDVFIISDRHFINYVEEHTLFKK